MAVPSPRIVERMRLSIEILPLADVDARGPYRDVALATVKGCKFALPVQLDDTMEQVWAQIEERYKRNYLTPAEASYVLGRCASTAANISVQRLHHQKPPGCLRLRLGHERHH
jgi:hypothetical protein